MISFLYGFAILYISAAFPFFMMFIVMGWGVKVEIDYYTTAFILSILAPAFFIFCYIENVVGSDFETIHGETILARPSKW